MINEESYHAGALDMKNKMIIKVHHVLEKVLSKEMLDEVIKLLRESTEIQNHYDKLEHTIFNKECIKKALLMQFDKWYEQNCKDENSACGILGPSGNITYYIEHNCDIFNDAMWFIMNNYSDICKEERNEDVKREKEKYE